MSLAEQVAEEFEAAQYLGGVWTHRAQVERWESEVWTPEARPLLEGTTPEVVADTCPRCGYRIEHRTGNRRVYHIGVNGGGCAR